MQKKHRITSAAASAVLAATSLTSVFAAPAVLADDASQYDNYAKLLQYSLYFYDTNMCGEDVGENSAISWRDDCHTSDEVQGGFHDAGDHVMFGLPQGFTASTIGWSYYEFPEAYDATGQGEHLRRLTDRFCQFFKNSTIRDENGDVTNFLYQKGDGNEDHAYWGAPERQNGSRRMYWTSDTASDIAAEYAAALAVNYINFGNPEDLDYAESLYRFSVKYNSITGEGTYGFYNNSDCRDEQAWAAGWLYKATENDYYLNECAAKQNSNIGWVHGWENVDLGSACIYAEITGDWSKVNNYIGNKATGSRYLFLDKWGSARLNCSMQFTALIADKYGAGSYTDWCKGQMNYILGDNQMNTCLVTGFASNSAKNTHHRAASGYDGFWGQSEYDSVNGKTLIGALAGGPEDENGTYSDVMNNYVSNEVAIDYNAGLVGAAAGLYSVYMTGSIDSEIEGVTTIYTNDGTEITPVVTTKKPVTTTTTTKKTTAATTTVTTTVKVPVSTAKPSGKAVVLNDVKLGETYDISKYSDISRIDVVFDKTPANGMNGCAVLGNWEFQNNYSGADLVNDTLTIVPDENYNTMTIHKWYGDVNLDSVIIYVGKSDDDTTEAVTTKKPATTTTTTTTAKPTTTTTTAKPTTTTTTTTTAKPTTTTTTTTTAKPTTTTTTTTTAKPTTTTTTTTTAKPTTTATTKPAETTPVESNTVVLKDVKYGESYALADYDYKSISKIVLKLGGDVGYGFGGNVVLGDWTVQNSYDHVSLTSDNTIEIDVKNPQSKMTVFNYWGNMNLESVTLVFAD